jgi:hypothetical protein
VALAQITPRREPQSLRSGSKQFPVDTLLAYDVLLFESSAVTANVSGKRLKDFQLIDGPNAVNYPGSGLPTFFLRSRSLPLNLLYGSCRKLHGPENDCLALADEMIDETLADLKARPSVLFLTGDQIYADDVAGPLIKHLTGLGNELLQWDEEESVPGMPKSSTIDVYQRQKLIERPGPAMFTSEHGHNHLLTFGEFAAMYLVAWNGQNWPESYPEYGGDREHNAQYREEIENLELARRTMPAVRRALANIPSYMIFDDHEITDDWNITRDWYEAVKKSPAGHRVVANGLAAFLMFQAWGNEPEMFAPRNRITSYFASNGQDPKAFEDDLWGFTGWTFVAPTDPPTVFIDTRTQRQYDTDSGPARLLSDAGINLLKKHSPKSDGRPLLLVSPAPLYGFDRIEKVQSFLFKAIEKVQSFLFKASGNAHLWDLEAWRANDRGFMDFIKVIIQDLTPRSCVLFSGDVHYAFAIGAMFCYEGRSLPITQLTSSALKNTGWNLKWTVGMALEPIAGLTDSVMVWDKKTPVSEKLNRLVGRIAAGQVPEQDLENVIREISTIQMLISTRPLKLDSQQAKDLEISTAPDWSESITYYGKPLSRLPIVGENNLGLVVLERNETRLEHVLLIKQEEKPMQRINIAIDIAPLKLQAQDSLPF